MANPGRTTRLLCAALLAAALSGLSPAQAALSPAQLLARYQPVTVLHPDELFPPVAVDGFLAGAVLEKRLSGAWTPSGIPTSTLPTADPAGCTSTARAPCWRLNQPACSAATGIASLACYAQEEAAHPAPTVVYGAVRRRGDRIALQYWYWYSYDFWSGQHPPSDFVWQAHEGDWEVVTVVLTSAGTPLFAGLSEHSCGKRRDWSRVPKWPATQHPVVHVALGSHANLFASRPISLDLRPGCYDQLGASILRALLRRPLDRTGSGARFGPALVGVSRARIVRITDTFPTWMGFPGLWGEENLFHAPDPIGTRDAGLPPVGPRFHRIWREPISTPLSWPPG